MGYWRVGWPQSSSQITAGVGWGGGANLQSVNAPDREVAPEDPDSVSSGVSTESVFHSYSNGCSARTSQQRSIKVTYLCNYFSFKGKSPEMSGI